MLPREPRTRILALTKPLIDECRPLAAIEFVQPLQHGRVIDDRFESDDWVVGPECGSRFDRNDGRLDVRRKRRQPLKANEGQVAYALAERLDDSNRMRDGAARHQSGNGVEPQIEAAAERRVPRYPDGTLADQRVERFEVPPQVHRLEHAINDEARARNPNGIPWLAASGRIDPSHAARARNPQRRFCAVAVIDPVDARGRNFDIAPEQRGIALVLNHAHDTGGVELQGLCRFACIGGRWNECEDISSQPLSPA